MQKDTQQGNKQQGEQQREQAREGKQQGAADQSNSSDDLIGMNEQAEVQQSAQREGMGHHRRSGRGNEQAIDAASDVDDLGNRVSSAGKSRP